MGGRGASSTRSRVVDKPSLKAMEKMVQNNEWIKLQEKGVTIRLQDWFYDKNDIRRIETIHKETEKAVYVTALVDGDAKYGYELMERQRWIPKSVLMVMRDEGEYMYEITPKKTIKYDKYGKKVK